MFSKILVANRGEIAIRAFRAAFELGVATVAVYPYEDRNSVHRLKADESYQIGEPGHPVRAYLSIDEIIRVAKHAGADAIYPGYGFLSENPDLAAACVSAGITFVGPSADVLELTGNKARGRQGGEGGGSAGTELLSALGVGGGAGGRGWVHAVSIVRQGGLGWRRSRYAESW
jgi:pyruvate carboxylase